MVDNPWFQISLVIFGAALGALFARLIPPAPNTPSSAASTPPVSRTVRRADHRAVAGDFGEGSLIVTGDFNEVTPRLIQTGDVNADGGVVVLSNGGHVTVRPDGRPVVSKGTAEDAGVSDSGTENAKLAVAFVVFAVVGSTLALAYAEHVLAIQSLSRTAVLVVLGTLVGTVTSLQASRVHLSVGMWIRSGLTIALGAVLAFGCGWLTTPLRAADLGAISAFLAAPPAFLPPVWDQEHVIATLVGNARLLFSDQQSVIFYLIFQLIGVLFLAVAVVSVLRFSAGLWLTSYIANRSLQPGYRPSWAIVVGMKLAGTPSGAFASTALLSLSACLFMSGLVGYGFSLLTSELST